MDPVVSTLIVILLALVGAQLTFSTSSTAQGLRLLFRTGTHFLLFGFLLGPQVLQLLSQDALEGLFPLTALGLGWVGFLFGLQLDRNLLREFEPRLYWIAYLQAVLALGIFAGLAWAGLLWFDIAREPWTAMAWAAAATAALSTPAGIAMISSNFMVRGPVRQLLFFVSSMDALVGIVALQIIYSVYHSPNSFPDLGTLPGFFWVAAAVALGVMCGIIFLWLTRRRPSSEELTLFLMGTCAFAAAAALRLHVSPLFVCVVMGAVVANLSPDHRRVFTAVQEWEKPIYVILLLLAGALLDLSNWLVWPLAGLYVVGRGFAKLVGTWLAVRIVRPGMRTPQSIGAGLLPQGGISLALAISVLLTFYDAEAQTAPAAQLLFGIVLLGVLISELVGPYFTMRVLRLAGEISSEVVEAIARGDDETARAAAIRHVPDPARAETAEQPPGQKPLDEGFTETGDSEE